MEEKPLVSDRTGDEGGWRRRFKGRVELLRHLDERIEVVVQLYSLPRPPDSGLPHTPLSYEEQVLFLSTVDPSVRLLLRVVAARASAAAPTATVTVVARSNRLPLLHQPGYLDIQLSADGQRFASRPPTQFGYVFSDVPIAALGSLRVELTLTLAR